LDHVLITNASNLEASCFWKGQNKIAVREGSLRYYLFENKGSLYHGEGFKMLAALEQHCHPNTVTNTFKTLSLFNNVQGELEQILKFWSRFDGLA
jgi:hypothetical protein